VDCLASIFRHLVLIHLYVDLYQGTKVKHKPAPLIVLETYYPERGDMLLIVLIKSEVIDLVIFLPAA